MLHWNQGRWHLQLSCHPWSELASSEKIKRLIKHELYLVNAFVSCHLVVYVPGNSCQRSVPWVSQVLKRGWLHWGFPDLSSWVLLSVAFFSWHQEPSPNLHDLWKIIELVIAITAASSAKTPEGIRFLGYLYAWCAWMIPDSTLLTAVGCLLCYCFVPSPFNSRHLLFAILLAVNIFVTLDNSCLSS